jgi:predicted MPP superfamily phosphohydrolase
MIYRFVHLSDIHFGQRSGTVAKHDSVRAALINDAKTIARARGPASQILVTGDIAYSGKADEYENAAEWLEQLAANCGCKVTSVCTIPGNHDCDRGSVTNQARMIYASLRAHTAEVLQGAIAEIVQDGDAANPFLPKLQAYSKFANAYGCALNSSQSPFWIKDFPLPRGIVLRFYGLTSVQVSNAEDALGNMVLGNRQYMLQESENIINVVLVHHPLDWFKDKQEASQYLQNNARVMMVGHEHTLNILKTQDALAKKEWLVVYAGATNPPEGDNFGYSYNWLEFSHEEKDGRQHLVVEVFPRVWIQQGVKFEADQNRLGGAVSSTKIEILCANLCPKAEPTMTAKPAIAVAAPVALDESSSKGSTAQPAAEPFRELVMTTEIAGFDRLRYLFWRYLDWQQRLKVLVEVDALPKTADQPIPQTLERVALENAAKTDGKLHEIWDVMMPLIPEGKRSTNPFKSNDR